MDNESLAPVLIGLALGAAIAITMSACAGGSGSYKPRPRAQIDKLYVPCDPSWISNPEGKLCNRTCLKRRGKECKEWSLTVKDMTDPKDWQFMKDGGFGCLDLDQIL